MKAESMVAVRADRKGGNLLGWFVALAATVLLLLGPTAADSAAPVSGPAGPPTVAARRGLLFSSPAGRRCGSQASCTTGRFTSRVRW